MAELIGRKVVAVRNMTVREVEAEGWDEGTTVIYASQDGI